MSNEKVMIIPLIVGSIKNILYKMSRYFPKQYRSFAENVEVELDFSCYATKAELKNGTRFNKSKSAAKSDLASLKSETDKIDVDKVNIVPVDLSKLSNVVNNDVVKKTVYNNLISKINNIDKTAVLKTKYDTDNSDLEKKLRMETKKYLILVDVLKKQILMLKLLE